MASKIRHVEIEQATIKSVKADLVSGTVAVTLNIPLLEALPLREDLSMMAFMSMPVEVTITQLQSELDLKFGRKPTPGNIMDEVADEINRTMPDAHAEVRHADS
jgi:hypothetical protein